MAGGGFVMPGSGHDGADEEVGPDGAHAVQWVGKAGVKGPRWARMPLLTAGMLGIQLVWSVEMGYASPYLLDLGLSKSHMSLVFMAGPLSGLIVQPLIGVFADRSRSRWGRRRPFMLAGVAICAFAMMLLGWARELSSLLGGGSGLAIAFAVLAIYLIDFSINAVMATDRALVVDTLPPAQQEEGSAWAGRMFGVGSVIGFFVGGLDLTPILPFLGNTQIQIMSFMTSSTLLFMHTFTAWAVSERVLLRDNRVQSQSSFLTNIKDIWDNIFSLPPGIRTVCIIQFFNFLAWFPTLFFTSVWVSEIYKASISSDGVDAKTFAADAVRAGNRALFLQALVVITVSVGAPFLVAESGVQVGLRQGEEYEMLGDGDENGIEPGEGMPDGISAREYSPDRVRGQIANEGIVERVKGAVLDLVDMAKSGQLFTLPIKGLTLVKVWSASMFLFAGAMGMTWFVSTVGQAYFVIALCGASWSLTNWAPFSLLGELILLDGQLGGPKPEVCSTPQERESTDAPPLYSSPAPKRPVVLSRTSSANHSRHVSRSSIEEKLHRSSPILGQAGSAGPSRPLALSRSNPPTPLRLQRQSSQFEIGDEDDLGGSNDNSIIVHHSDDEDDVRPSSRRSNSYPLAPRSPISPKAGTGNSGKSTADKAGVILGIHNVFVVLPQFLVTGLSSAIFWLMEPEVGRGLPGKHPSAGPAGNVTAGVEVGMGPALGLDAETLSRVLRRAEGMAEGGSPDAVGLIFRIGGISAAVGGVICWRLARRWARGQGI